MTPPGHGSDCPAALRLPVLGGGGGPGEEGGAEKGWVAPTGKKGGQKVEAGKGKGQAGRAPKKRKRNKKKRKKERRP